MPKFRIEVTDTFGGEANYSWVCRFECTARSERGAVQWLARNYGKGWTLAYDCGDQRRYNLRGACVCAFIDYGGD